MTPAVATHDADVPDVPPLGREVVTAGVGVCVLGLVAYGLTLGFHLGNLHNGLLALSFTGVGLYVLRSRPHHLVGRLFLGLGLAAGLMFAGRQWGLHDPALPGADWSAWISIWLVPLVMAGSALATMVFPDGSHLSRRWRAAAIVMVCVAAVVALASALWPIEDDWATRGLAFPFHLGGADVAQATVWPVMVSCYLGSQVLAAAAVIIRWRRAGTEEAYQLRWIVYAVSVFVVLLLVGTILWDTPILGMLTVPLVPVAAGVAIVRHRLYDIDPVINKTLVLGSLIALVTLGYVAVVVVVGSLLPGNDRVLTLIATAAIAVAFEPVRRAAQAAADRLVTGRRSTPYETLSRVSSQLTRTDERLLDGLAAAVAAGTGASHVAIWVGDTARLERAATWPVGEVTTEPRPLVALLALEQSAPVVRPVVHDGVVRGALAVRLSSRAALSPGEEQLVADLAAQAGLVIDHQARLDQVARQSVELRAAARRLVTAQDRARRRIERDLHDGAQQKLVALGMDLGVIVDRAATTGDRDLVRRTSEARERLLDATAELRELARGLHPAVLTHDGLAAALATLADGSSLPVRLQVDVDQRLAAEVESTAYFVVSEALTNAARHSGAGVVDVTVMGDGERLVVEVTDDGAGGVDATGGSGLQGLADRLAALGSRLEVVSEPGQGTTIRTVIPCA